MFYLSTSSPISAHTPFSILTCKSLFKTFHFLYIFKVVFHLYQHVHVFHHQFLTEKYTLNSK